MKLRWSLETFGIESFFQINKWICYWSYCYWNCMLPVRYSICMWLNYLSVFLLHWVRKEIVYFFIRQWQSGWDQCYLLLQLNLRAHEVFLRKKMLISMELWVDMHALYMCMPAFSALKGENKWTSWSIGQKFNFSYMVELFFFQMLITYDRL